VRVVEVDLARKRIALSMKLDAPAGTKGAGNAADNSYRPAARGERLAQPSRSAASPAQGNAMAAAFAKLQTKR
jgi:uncharacterized protein